MARLNGIERLALANARGGPDNSGITERGIRGLFYDALETSAQNIWARQVGLYLPSDTLVEKHRWLGQVPEPRKHFGGLNATGLTNFSLDVTNEDFEATVEFSLHDWRRDKVGNITRRFSELARSFEEHWNSLSVTQLESGNLAYDGVALFSASHSIGSSGTLSNLLTSSDLASLNVTTAAAPTKAECGRVLADLAAYFYRYKDDQGRPANQGAKRFMLLCHPAVAPGFIQAVRDEYYVQGGTNETRNLGQTFDIVPEPRLASTTVVYMFRTDGPSSKPLILQEEKAPSIQVVGPDSEHAIKNNSVLAVAKACRAVAPGEWRMAIKATLS